MYDTAEVILIHINPNIRRIGQEEAMHKKHKPIKLTRWPALVFSFNFNFLECGETESTWYVGH
jgi:hypothetical protein